MKKLPEKGIKASRHQGIKSLLPWCLGAFLCFVVSASHAQLKDLTINADRVSFEREKNRIEAQGSVEVLYKDLRVSGEHLIYNTSAESVFADRGFKLFYEGISIEGETLDYMIKQKEGRAGKIKFIYEGLQMGGERVDVTTDRFQLKNAYFTTCSLAGPHYHVTAADVTLYPRHGWLVAYWGVFWLGKLPVVPMPTYIYDFRAGERARKNLPPFPEVGANEDDGSYLSEKLAWHLRRELSGAYTLGYAANKGFNAGIEANYILDEGNEGDIRLNWNPKNQAFGGITHRYSFGGEVSSPAVGRHGELFPSPRLRQWELEATVSSRERINYQRVSFYPDLTLRSRRSGTASYDLEVTAGMVAEEGNAELLRAGGNFRLYGEALAGCLTPTAGLDYLAYSNGNRWVKPSVGAELFLRELSLKMSYLHFLFIEGSSPFNFEKYRFRAADRLGGSVLFKIGETAAAVSTSYFLDNWSPEDIDYSLFFKLHCYNLAVGYRSLRREFVLGFSLAS